MSDSFAHPAGSTIFDGPDHRAVMTYNLKNGQDVKRWRQRRAALIEVIRHQRPLLLGTQEGYRYQLDDIQKGLPDYDFVGVGRYTDGTNEYNAIFYDTTRVKIARSGTFWLSNTPELPGTRLPGSTLPRIATWARCILHDDGRQILFVNTHLTHQSHDIEEQTRILVRELERLIDPAIDTILTGDFNQSRRTPTWHALEEIGFIDAWTFANEVKGPVFTFPNWSQWDDERAASVTRENRIDWIMYRPGENRPLPRNVEIQTINTHTGEIIPSDHFPVVLSNQR